MDISQHPWPTLIGHLRVEAYDRDGGHSHPRKRIEVIDPPNVETRNSLLATTVQCVRCGTTIHPIRERDGWGTLFLAVTCRLDDNVACARGGEARDAYATIIAAVESHDGSSQPSLF